MDEDIVGFPGEADNTLFEVAPHNTVAELREKFREVVYRESIGELLVVEFVLDIMNEHFDGTIRVFIPTDQLTNEKEHLSELFFLTGTAILLDIEGEETNVYLEVGGQIEFFDESSDVLLGALSVWPMRTSRETGLRDAS
jgi:hypothetical protein